MTEPTRSTPEQYEDEDVLVDRDGDNWIYSASVDVWRPYSATSGYGARSYQSLVATFGPVHPPVTIPSVIAALNEVVEYASEADRAVSATLILAKLKAITTQLEELAK